MGAVKTILATLAYAIVVRIDSIAPVIRLVRAVYVRQSILTCGPYIESDINNVAALIAPSFHTVSVVGCLRQADAA